MPLDIFPYGYVLSLAWLAPPPPPTPSTPSPSPVAAKSFPFWPLTNARSAPSSLPSALSSPPFPSTCAFSATLASSQFAATVATCSTAQKPQPYGRYMNGPAHSNGFGATNCLESRNARKRTADRKFAESTISNREEASLHNSNQCKI